MTHYLSFIQNVMISFDWIKGCRGDIPLETLDFGIVAPPVGTPWYVCIYIDMYRCKTEVWNRGMERILQAGMERGYGTGVCNGPVVPDHVADLVISLAPILPIFWLVVGPPL